MKAYWDSSALVEAVTDPALRARLKKDRGFFTIDVNDFQGLPDRVNVVAV
jgi:hypothetical protein